MPQLLADQGKTYNEGVMARDRIPTVLIVEDDAGLREAYRTALTVAGYAVVAVEDGVDALRRLEIGVPDAIVLDLALPRMHGLDVHRELIGRSETREVPVVIVTGEDVSDLDPSAFACVLRKPIDPGALVDAIEACLRGHGWLSA
jgi:DNA-binding response OmpR family regulator